MRFLKNDVQIPLCNEFDDDVTTTTCSFDVSFRELSRVLHQPPPRADPQLSKACQHDRRASPAAAAAAPRSQRMLPLTQRIHTRARVPETSQPCTLTPH